MRILFLCQFCFPEPDFKCFPFAKELKKHGFTVEVLTGYPNYPGGKVYPGYKIKGVRIEYIDGIRIIRVPLYADHSNSGFKRILNYLSFAFSALFFGPFFIKKPAIIYAYHAPATIALPAIFFKLIFRSKIVYDINDYWPDTLSATGMINNKMLIALISWYCRFSYKFFNAINVVTKGFKVKLLENGVPEEKISVIYNWSLPIGFNSCEELKFYSHVFDNYFSIVYAGNIGKAQELEVIINAAKRLKILRCHSIRFILIGDGIELKKLTTMVTQFQLHNVVFIPKVPPNSIGCFLKKANALLLHLKEDPLFKITIPSKIAAYFLIGKPILSGVSGETEELLNNSNAGYNFIPADEDSLVEKVMSLYQKTGDELHKMGKNGKTFYANTISFEKGVESFVEIFYKLGSQA